MFEQRHDQPPHAAGNGNERPAFGGARLDLPRFQFAPAATPMAAPPAPAPAPAFAPAHAPAAAPMPQAFATPQLFARPAAPAPAAPVAYQPYQQPQPAGLTYAVAPPTWNSNATAIAQPVQVAQPPVQSRAASAMAMANATRPVTVSWERLEAPSAERTLLQKITPVHMGVMLVMVILVMVVTSGPAAMTATPWLSAATVSGGGTGVDMLPVGSGTTAVDALAPDARSNHRARAAAVAPARSTYLKVGSARLVRTVHAGGIPSPAASANLAVSGGGRAAAGSTDAVQMDGIPSPAAAEKLGPQTLPYRPSDGVTLPRTAGERDSHAVDTHYGTSDLPMSEPVELPAMSPGQAAARDEQRVVVNGLAGGTASAPNVSGGLQVAY
jgi:hypothetical protein